MADPVRIPNAWSPAWMRRFYVEVIARQSVPIGGLVFTESDPAELYGFGEWTTRGSGEVAGVTVTAYQRIA